MTFAFAGAAIATIFFFQSEQDGVVDEDEKHFMHTVNFITSIGLMILVPWELFTMGYALITQGPWHEYTVNPENWFRIVILGVIIINSGMRQVREIPEWFPSAVTLGSLAYYYYISIMKTSDLAIITLSYVATVLLFTIILQILRKIYLR